MRSIYPDLMIKMLLGNNKKIYMFFADFSCMQGVCAYMNTAFLVVEIADRFFCQAFYGNNLLLTKNRRGNFVLLLLQETWIFLNGNIV